MMQDECQPLVLVQTLETSDERLSLRPQFLDARRPGGLAPRRAFEAEEP
jgi:hypothetical protein